MATDTDLIVASTAATPQEHHSYVDWPAIFAGIVVASAISLVLLAFGSAVGLSFANFRGQGANPVWIGIAAALWLLWVEVSSFMAGGYLVGRLRRRFHDANEHESDVRDGAHGLIVWAGALLIGALIAVSGVGSALNAVGSIASTVTTAASNVAGGAAQGATDNGANPANYFVDQLFRTPAPAEGSAPAPAANGTGNDYRAEAGRILAQSALNGSVSDQDKTYLAQLVSTNTGLSQQDAAARVDQVNAAIDGAKNKAADAAETARKTAVLAAFLTAASLLVSAVGAYWAAMKGGRHRDEGTVFTDVFGRF